MLRVDLRVGETIRIGEVVITVEKKSGQLARLGIDAPGNIKISRVANDNERRTEQEEEDAALTEL